MKQILVVAIRLRKACSSQMSTKIWDGNAERITLVEIMVPAGSHDTSTAPLQLSPMQACRPPIYQPTIRAKGRVQFACERFSQRNQCCLVFFLLHFLLLWMITVFQVNSLFFREALKSFQKIYQIFSGKRASDMVCKHLANMIPTWMCALDCEDHIVSIVGKSDFSSGSCLLGSIFPSFLEYFSEFLEYFPNFPEYFQNFHCFFLNLKYLPRVSEYFFQILSIFQILTRKNGILDPRIPLFFYNACELETLSLNNSLLYNQV